MKTYHFFVDNGGTLEEISMMTKLKKSEAEREVKRLCNQYKKRVIAMVVFFECDPDSDAPF